MKLLHIRSLGALRGREICRVSTYLVVKEVVVEKEVIGLLETTIGRNVDQVSAYIRTRGATWKEYG